MITSEINIGAGYLVVPIDVEAMCVGNESDNDNTFTADPYQFNLLKHKDVIPLSKHIHRDTTTPMKKGIYLHWALPDGLTHGIEKSGELKFPVVPNRWLVSRLINGATFQHWVVESDYLSDENKNESESKQAIPYKLEERNTAIKYMGRALKLEDWQTQKNTIKDYVYPNLTATGYGIPEFAASYQHSKGVFSFYDGDIKDQDDVSISYFVVGWYENYGEKHPILEGSDIENKKITELLERYKWCLTDYTNIENTNINEIYCSGSISGINWNSKKRYLNDLPYPEISLAIGHNENEALSALIAGLSEGVQQSEQLLNALQLGILEDVIQPNSINDIQNVNIKINDATFQSNTSGSYWQIEPETTNDGDNWKLDKILTNKDLSDELNELNQLQKQSDDWQQQLIARKQQLYLYWTASLKPNTRYQTELRLYLQEQVETLEVLNNKEYEFTSKINESKCTIEKLLETTNCTFILKNYQSARYYKPLEPVLLFQGSKISCPQRYGGDGTYTSNNRLICRLSNQLISKVSVNNIDISNDVLDADFKVVPKEIIEDLLFINPNFLYIKNNNLSVDGYKNVIKQFILPEIKQDDINLKQLINQEATRKENLYRTISQPNRATGQLQFTGISPSPVGINFWENNPWLPLYFKYDVSYHPVNSKSDNNFDSEFITDNFNLNHESDKLIAKSYNSFSKEAIHYQNTCLLSQHSKVNLQEKIKDFISKHPEQTELDDTLKQLLTVSQQLPDLLSQSLFGLNDALVGLKNTLQLRVINYDENTSLQNLANAVDKLIDGSNCFELDQSDGSSHYYPLSAGLLKINSLTIVDAFGRNIEVPKNKLFSASSLLVNDSTITNVYLAPRLVAPSKLNANWLDNNNKPINGLLATNPILGWIMPNFIDKSIWLFTSDGKLAGQLTVSGWEETPGSRYSSFDEVKEKNTEFKNVLGYLEKKLELFLDKVKETLIYNQPENHRSLNTHALFFGVPLAIAKINVEFEIEGLPPIDYSENSIKAALEDDDVDVFFKNKFKHCQDLNKVNIPVLIGNNNHIGDGLITYCKSEDYTTFYYENEEQILNINGYPLELCAIFDPRNNIHLHTGILPVKELRMPQQYYASILQNMQLAIEVPSLIAATYTEDGPIKMPLPNAESNNWQWWFENETEWKSIPAQEEHDDAVNEGFNVHTKGWLKLTNKM